MVILVAAGSITIVLIILRVTWHRLLVRRGEQSIEAEHQVDLVVEQLTKLRQGQCLEVGQ